MAKREDGMPVPEIMVAASPEEVDRLAEEGLRAARSLLDRLVEEEGPRTVANTLHPYNDLLREVYRVADQGNALSNLHPEKTHRDAGERAHQAAEALDTELSLHRPLYEAFAALDVSGEDESTQYAVEKTLRDFRRAGVDRDEATRKEIKALRDEIVEIGQAFERNIREDVRSIRVEPEALDGLPEDFLEEHPPDEEGLVTLTTNYPDLFPVLKYAHREEVRRDLMEVYLGRGHPNNLEVLDRLLAKRHELAELLGYGHWAAYITEDKMIETAEAAAEFIERVTSTAADRSEVDYEALLARKREDDPQAEGLERWDRMYYAELVRNEEYGYDAKAIRAYFPFERVRDGLLNLTSQLFDVAYEPVEDAPVWHDSVATYDIFQDGRRLGRFYLDLHPRDGKFSHAASATVFHGVEGVQLPQALLMCNFPDPSKGPALMEHSDVTTFFHEFGHLLHSLLSGRVPWIVHTMGRIEWDFVEVPSQLLEEWTRDPESLATFARHYETGEPISADLVERMRKADAVARGLHVRRQMALAAISLNYYNRNPAGLDTTALARELTNRYDPIPWFEGTHFQCGFGHLTGYSAIYYTYMWSLVIAKDLFGRFQEADRLLDPAVAAEYRRAILEPGSSRPAGDLVRAFLGRDPEFDAFASWVTEGAET